MAFCWKVSEKETRLVEVVSLDAESDTALICFAANAKIAFNKGGDSRAKGIMMWRQILHTVRPGHIRGHDMIIVMK